MQPFEVCILGMSLVQVRGRQVFPAEVSGPLEVAHFLGYLVAGVFVVSVRVSSAWVLREPGVRLVVHGIQL